MRFGDSGTRGKRRTFEFSHLELDFSPDGPLEPMRFGDSGAKRKRRFFAFEVGFITARFAGCVELGSDFGSSPSLPLVKFLILGYMESDESRHGEESRSHRQKKSARQ